ncbi:MAG: hypothetical protein CVU11_04280 [Bacteroidetes bacterium HGW-Bacteroidetes-6]|nr:MAG: hypothetical protein CVU11_04280 [Bacteroidetes bacterium HGW-Bacteroidetes-6]
MNFEFEKTGELTALLKANIESADYQSKVEEKLRQYRRKASMPGFRPGKVPFGVIKKMYGASTLADEVLHTASEAVYKYLEENKIDFILSPLMDEDKARDIEWIEGNTFEFSFDIAMNPEIDPVADDSLSFIRYNVTRDENDVDNYLADIRERYGRFEKAEYVDDKSFISAQVVETNAKDEEKEGGINKFIHLRVRSLPANLQAMFMGKKSEDVLSIDIEKDMPNADDRTEVFNTDIETARAMSGFYRLTLQSVLTIIPADFDEKLFNEVFPNHHIENEEQLRNAIRDDVERTYEKESRKQLYFDIQKELKNKYSFELPEAFMKKYIKQRSEKDLSQDDIDKGYPFYAEEMKWQLIENKIITKYKLAVGRDEVRSHIKELLGLADLDENDADVKQRIDQVYEIIAQDKEKMSNMVDNMTDEKIIKLFEDNCKIETKSLNWKEFTTLVNEKN